ncbi:saccharopine dehydrogenase NADP-binding domain-containing protein [Rheinheimera baltica]|uniref:Saccharopine dehydrogenase NADP-binding domain-containing protein n=1 Tax=Rheinheimera baltica TaxID=67576 RepID=A0ABT9HUE7_9GAMM|nr:saccharopine dehydrogenase C-terminal domain-containing protein [Rheinheimera baltica]MDP5134749.1 saccharopine dehydrogenase NADP-binding domain-containing protein [Rheinheimera baltica]
MEQIVSFNNRIVILGLGTIARCLVDVIDRHIKCSPSNITFIEPGEANIEDIEAVQKKGFNYVICRKLTKINFAKELDSYLTKDSLFVNLTCSVDSIDLMELVHARGMMYVDSSFEIWDEEQVDNVEDMQHQTLYALHNRARKVSKYWSSDSPTAITNHGANPGIVNHFAKAALVELTKSLGILEQIPESRQQWAALAKKASVKVIHISERDSQVEGAPKPVGEFRNTWSPVAYMDEAGSPVEIGWGTHESELPRFAKQHQEGPGNSLYFHRLGGEIFVKSWLPQAGQIYGYLMPHSECVTLSEYFTLYEGTDVIYRPTVKFAYLPAPDAFVSLHEYMMGDSEPPLKIKVMKNDIVAGADELGVLLLGHDKRAFWYGSCVDIERSREVAPGHNATTVQVIGGVVSAIVWCLNNPRSGYCETESLPYEKMLAIAEPYIAPMFQTFSDWTPNPTETESNEKNQIEEQWQFQHFLVGG